VARIITEPLSDQEKDQIVQELEEEGSSGRGMATQFAQDAQQYTQMVEIPSEYQRHEKVFDEEASNHSLCPDHGTMPSNSKKTPQGQSIAKYTP
jgi:hypothetical protein